jgi:hypothetical protein
MASVMFCLIPPLPTHTHTHSLDGHVRVASLIAAMYIVATQWVVKEENRHVGEVAQVHPVQQRVAYIPVPQQPHRQEL